jgi:hypothetical protein
MRRYQKKGGKRLERPGDVVVRNSVQDFYLILFAIPHGDREDGNLREFPPHTPVPKQCRRHPTDE